MRAPADRVNGSVLTVGTKGTKSHSETQFTLSSICRVLPPFVMLDCTTVEAVVWKAETKNTCHMLPKPI